MKRPFEKQDRIASAPSLEALRKLLIAFWHGSAIEIKGSEGFWTVHNAKGFIPGVGIFRETTRGKDRFWAYYTGGIK
jgi:hypothetical protein